MDIDNCDPLSVFLNLETGQIECLPGVLIPPPGYSQLGPEVTVTPENAPRSFWFYIALGIVAVAVLKQ